MRKVGTSSSWGALGRGAAAAVLAVAVAGACGKSDKPPAPRPSPPAEGAAAAGDAAAGGAGAEEAAGPPLEAATVELKFRNSADNRDMVFKVSGQLPKWPLDQRNSREGNKIWRSTVDPKALFSAPSFAVSATCHGACEADKLAANTAQFVTQRLGAAKPEAVLKDGAEVRPGVSGFAVRTGKVVDFGVTHRHWQDTDYLVYCAGQVPPEMFDRAFAACVGLDVKLVDPLVGEARAAEEEGKLAQCPAASSVRLVAREGQTLPEGMKPMDAAKVTVAVGYNPGSLHVHLADFEMKTDEKLDKAPLTEGQQVLQLAFQADKGDVLSGEYPARAGAGQNVRVDIKVPGGTSFGLGVSEGSATILARTRKKVCGRFDIKDKVRHLTGTFVADVVRKAP